MRPSRLAVAAAAIIVLLLGGLTKLVTGPEEADPAARGSLALSPSYTLIDAENAWPQRVLIVNDDGIDEPVTRELARAFAASAETYLIAPTIDRSGTTNYLSALGTGSVRVERREIGDAGIVAFAVHGYPADCIVFALTGLLANDPPDLVISGVNGGPNLGDAWIASGTIGAARMAAYLGVPALSISGVDSEDPAAVRAVVSWVVELARSPPVRDLEPPEYLTVSLPVGPPDQIRGIELARRARGSVEWIAQPRGSGADGGESWSLRWESDPTALGLETDVAALERGSIAIVPMRADENDPALRQRLARSLDAFPAWRPDRR